MDLSLIHIFLEQKFYICKHCGNIIAKVKDTGVPVILSLIHIYQNGSCVSVRSISMAAMLTAAVVTAGVTFLAMLVVMVITVNIGCLLYTSLSVKNLKH